MFEGSESFVGVVDLSFRQSPGGTTTDASLRKEGNEVLRRFQQAAGRSCQFLPGLEHRTLAL